MPSLTTSTGRPALDPLAARVRSVAAFSARHRKLVIVAWLVLVIGSIYGSTLTGTTMLSDTDSNVGESAAAQRLAEQKGLATPPSENIMLSSSSAAKTTAAAGELAATLRTLPEAKAVTAPGDGSPGASTLTADGGRTALVHVTLRGSVDDAGDTVVPIEKAVTSFASQNTAMRVAQAGDGTIDRGFSDLIENDLHRVELISLPLTLAILLITFGALVAALVPLLLGVTSVAAAFGIVGMLSGLVPVSDTTMSVIVLIGLAVGVDYSLFCIRREREERRRGRGPEAALDATMATVGRAVVVAGATVVIALAGLLFTGSGVFTSMAVGTIAVVAIAVLGSLTVLPATLALLGDRIDRGRVPLIGRLRRNGDAAGVGAWGRLTARVTRHAGVAATLSIAVLAALAFPATGLKTADSSLSQMPKDLPVFRALTEIGRTFPGAPDPATLVVSGKDLGTSDAQQRLEQFGAGTRDATGGRGPVVVRVAADGSTAVVEIPAGEHDGGAAIAATRELRDQADKRITTVSPDASVQVTGSTAMSADFNQRMRTATPLVVLFVLGLAFVLLLAAFRSALLAGAMVLLNMLSVGAAYGMLVLVFQHTWAEGLLGFTSSGTVTTWLPLMAFVILFGLSMDYTIIVLERIREGRIAGLSPREAAAQGIASTAGTVTSAAAVMIVVFSLFATMRFVEMKEMGFALAAAILVDATLVRGIALPAVVTLIGRRWRVPARPEAMAGAEQGAPVREKVIA